MAMAMILNDLTYDINQSSLDSKGQPEFCMGKQFQIVVSNQVQCYELCV